MLYTGRKPTIGELAALPYLHHPRYRGCVGHWLMAEGGGGTVHDISGHGNQGTLVNGPVWDIARSRPVVFFNGSTNYLNVGNAASLNLNDVMSVSFWMNGLAVIDNYSVMIGKINTSTAGWNVDINNVGPIIRTVLYTSGGLNQFKAVFSPGIETGWHHIVVVLNAGSIKGYADGVQSLNSTYIHGTGFATPAELHIGNRSDNTNYFHGHIDDVRLYNRALSPAEVSSLFTSPLLEFEEAILTLRRHQFSVPSAHRFLLIGGLVLSPAAWIIQRRMVLMRKEKDSSCD